MTAATYVHASCPCSAFANACAASRAAFVAVVLIPATFAARV